MRRNQELKQRHAPPPLPPKKRKQSISTTTRRTEIPEFIDTKKSKGMFSGNTFKLHWSNERPRHERVCLAKN